jgi:small-conductance mechanosensitive channel
MPKWCVPIDLTQILLKFAEAGIEIAFPQRDLHLRTIPAELTSVLSGVGK